MQINKFLGGENSQGLAKINDKLIIGSIIDS
jgi:hypothetical protein